MALKLAVGPTLPALLLSEAKKHLRVDISEDDTLVTAMIEAATQEAEHRMGRAIMPQQWQLTLDSFFDPSIWTDPVPITIDLLRGPTVSTGAAALNLARPPVTSVDSVKYVDPNGVLQTLASSEWQLAAATEYGARLVPAYGKTWPATRVQPEAVQVLFSCGYANVSAVPALIKAWLLMRVGSLYEHREQWTSSNRSEGALNENAFVNRLLDRYCVPSF